MTRWCLLCAALLCAGAACDDQPAERPPPPATKNERKDPPKRVEIAKNIFLEVDGDRRRVLVLATVCLQRGPLELLLTRANTKEHEAILAADVDARELHKA